jgi:hypothetical protein
MQLAHVELAELVATTLYPQNSMLTLAMAAGWVERTLLLLPCS